MLGLHQDDAAARAAQRLVRGRGDDVGVRHRVRVEAGGDQAGVVAMSTQKMAPISFATLAKRSKSMRSAKAEAPATMIFGLCSRARRSHGVVVDVFLGVEAVGDDVEPLAGHVQRHAVRQVAAFGRLMPMIVSPGLAKAISTAWLACEPEFGWTLAASAPNSFFRRSMASCSACRRTHSHRNSACPDILRRTCWSAARPCAAMTAWLT